MSCVKLASALLFVLCQWPATFAFALLAMQSVAPCSRCRSSTHVLFRFFLSAAMIQEVKRPRSRDGCWHEAASHRALLVKACLKKKAGAAGKRGGLRSSLLPKIGEPSLVLLKKGKKKCRRYGCRNLAASHRARFCIACFKKNAAAVGRLRGNREKVQRKCSRHGCRNDVQGSRWARLCPACFMKNQCKVTKAAGKRSALLSHQAARWALALKNFLKYRGIRLVNAKQGGKVHAFVMT